MSHAGMPGFLLGCAVTDFLYGFGFVREAQVSAAGRDLLDRARKAGVL